MKKYKISKRKKNINPYYIFLIFAISLLFVSSGYAIFSDNLYIKGTANINPSGVTKRGEYIFMDYYWRKNRRK